MALKLIGLSENAAMLPDDYGCKVANRFCQLVDDDADPFDFIKHAEVQKEKKKKANQMTVKPKKPGQRESQKDRRVPVLADREDNLPGTKTGGKWSARGGVFQNETRGVVEAESGARRGVLGECRTNQEEHPPEYSFQKPAHYAYGQVQGGGYRNMDTTGSFNLRGKREYERRSGTVVSLEEKRGGRGPWNRGCVQDSISMGDIGVNVKPDAGGIPPEAGQQPAEMAGENHLSEVEGDVVVQVAMEMSLDEWKALQEQRRPKAEFNLRKLDCKVPSKARVIHKSKRIENLKVASVEEQEDDCHFSSLRRSANDITSHVEFNFDSLLRPSRGGKGQGRGERGGVTERAYVLAPNPEDPDDFPALTVGR